jgi:hypothetical protein
MMDETTFSAELWKRQWYEDADGESNRAELLSQLVERLAETTPSGYVRLHCPSLFELVNLARIACCLPELEAPGLHTHRAKRKRNADRTGEVDD